MPNLAFASFTALAAGLIAAAAPAAAQDISLRFIGQQTLPAGTMRLDTTVGGLSGIDYDASRDVYVAISDDPSGTGPARFYTVDLQLTPSAFSGVTFTGVETFKTPAGATYTRNTIDPEAIRFAANGNIFYASEGFATASPPIAPFVREANATGGYVRDFAVPSYYAPVAAAGGTPASGIRNNLAFESLTRSNDNRSLVTATENALAQDGPTSTATTGSPSRILFFDLVTGAATAEYVYANDPLAVAPNPSTQFGVNGLVELVAAGGDSYLALERSFSVGAPGTGYSIKLYDISLAGATNVLGTASLAGQSYTPVTKRLVFDFATLGIALDNLEAVTFGERLANGNRSLIVVGDDNFSAAQFQQFLAFEVSAVPEPSTWAMMIAGMAAVAVSLRRRRPHLRPATS